MLRLTGRVLLQEEQESARSARQRHASIWRIAHDFNPDFISSGALIADAARARQPRCPADHRPHAGAERGAQHRRLPERHFQRERRRFCFPAIAPPSRSSAAKPAAAKSTSRASSAIRGRASFSNCRRWRTQVRVRYPEGVSTVANADLRLTGTSERSTLGGHHHDSAHRVQSAVGLQLDHRAVGRTGAHAGGANRAARRRPLRRADRDRARHSVPELADAGPPGRGEPAPARHRQQSGVSGTHQHHAGPGGLLRHAVHDQPGLGGVLQSAQNRSRSSISTWRPRRAASM